MTDTPKISVVIPAYNHEQFIGAAIESVLGQSLQNFEIVIVDDGSTDGTASVINSYEDDRIAYTWQENADAFNTINRAMAQARGEYISILNSDDVYTPDRLETLYNHCRNQDKLCVFTDVCPISDEGELLSDPDFGWNIWHQENRTFYREQGDLYRGFLHGNFMVTTSNLFMHRQVLEKTGQFAPIRYLHDYDYIFRILLNFPDGVSYLQDQQLLHYRIHSGNTLSQAAITGREQDLQVIEKYMLAKVDADQREYVRTGSRRLRQLEREINEVRTQLANMQGQTESTGAGHRLMRGIRRRLVRMLGQPGGST